MQNYLNLIEAEVNRAKALHPNNGIDLNHSIVILTEEVGEAAKAALDYQQKGKSIQDLRDELIQCGAMVIRSLELIENYSDVKVTASETPQFKVGDRVQFMGKRGLTNGVIVDIENSHYAVIDTKQTRYEIDLRDLTLITNE